MMSESKEHDGGVFSEEKNRLPERLSPKTKHAHFWTINSKTDKFRALKNAETNS